MKAREIEKQDILKEFHFCEDMKTFNIKANWTNDVRKANRLLMKCSEFLILKFINEMLHVLIATLKISFTP